MPTGSALDQRSTQVDGDPVFVAMKKCWRRGREPNLKRKRLKQRHYCQNFKVSKK